MRNLDRKAEVAKFIHVVLTQGYPNPGRSNGSKNGASSGKATVVTAPVERVTSAITVLTTVYPKMEKDFSPTYGTTQFASVCLAAVAFKQEPAYLKAKEDVTAWCEELKKNQVDLQYTIAGELCPESYKAGTVRLHFHIFLKRKGNHILTLPAELKFQGQGVHMIRGVIDRRNVIIRVNQGSYYCGVRKIGGIDHGGNYLPYKDFAVNPNWVTHLACQEKVSLQTARQEYLRCVDRAEHYIRNVEWIIQQKREAREEEERMIVAAKIRQNLRPMSMPPTWDDFLAQFNIPNKHRFSFYVLDGPSGLGKTECVRLQFPLGSLLELNCQNTQSPNWRLFNRDLHSAILLDEATPNLVINFKKEVQADNTICQEGTSGTNVFAFKCWFYRVRFVVACNNWAELMWNMWYESPENHDWLEQNSVYQSVNASTFNPRAR